MLNNKNEYIIMADVEENHWWYKSLRHLVITGIKKNFKDSNISIIDAGCGTGGTINHLQKAGYINITGFDRSEHAVQICRRRNLNVFQDDIRNIGSHFKDNSTDVIICNDVFYFFTDSERMDIMMSFCDILRKIGIIIMILPAMNIFSGIHDRAVGIAGRFTRDDVGKIAGNIPLGIVKNIFWPFVLSPFIFAVRIKQRLQLKLFKKTGIKSDLHMPNKIINEILYRMVLIENTLFNSKPMGSSIFLILKNEKNIPSTIF